MFLAHLSSVRNHRGWNCTNNFLKCLHTWFHWGISPVSQENAALVKAKVKQDMVHMQNLHAILRRISRNHSQSRQAWRYKAQRIKNKLNSCQNTHITQIKYHAVVAKGKSPVRFLACKVWQYIKQCYHKRSIRHTSSHKLQPWNSSHIFWVLNCMCNFLQVLKYFFSPFILINDM